MMMAAPFLGTHKPILAERFKSKMCKNFEDNGVCPYEERCMFAHGEHELRTPEMNVADNLVTEEAIKAFQKARAIAARSAQKKRERDALRLAMRGDEAETLPLPPSPQESYPQHFVGTYGALSGTPRPQLKPEVLEAAESCGSLTPSHTPRRTYVLEYDAAKYVSPLAAAMLCRPKAVDSCHCAACSGGSLSAAGATPMADDCHSSILLA